MKDPRIARLVALWPKLSETHRDAVLAVTEGCARDDASGAKPGNVKPGMVKARVCEALRGMRESGEAWTSYAIMAERLGTVKSVVHAVVRGDVGLRAWAKMPKGGAKPARGLDGYTDELVTRDEVLSRLIEEQEADERADRIHKRA